MTDEGTGARAPGLAGIEPLDLPTDAPRHAAAAGPPARHPCAVPTDLVVGVRKLAAERGAQPAQVLLAAFQVLLGVYSRQSEVAVGVLLPGGDGDRRALLARVDLAADPCFGDLAERVRDGLNDDAVALPDPASASPRAWFAHAASVDGVSHELALVAQVTDDAFEVAFSADPALFGTATVERIARHWLTLLAGAVADPGRTVGALDLLDPTERRLVLGEWSGNPVRYPTGRSVAELVDEWVRARPDEVAVESGPDRLTYARLDARARDLAGRLVARGVRPEVPVAVCLERGIDLVVALLAIHRAGGACVPLDAEFPRERLAYVLADCAAPVVVTQHDLRDRVPVPDDAVVFVDEVVLVDAPVDADEPAPGDVPSAPPGSGDVSPAADRTAYVLYTSGSTGTPKGVPIRQSSLVNLLFSVRDRFGFQPGQAALSATSITFDIAQTEVFLPLISGGRVVIASRADVHHPAALAELVVRHDVTLVQATPSAWRQLVPALAAHRPHTGRHLLTAGEPLPPDLAAAMAALGGQVSNGYGPTETTVYATMAQVRDPRSVTIGRPTANTRLYVVDAGGRPVPVGVPGELWIGGAGVAPGYLNRPDLTAERFLPDPFSDDPDARVYRSGDLVRWRPDGELDYLGRLDHQVKVRGFRIEPGEIEAVLVAHDDVAACVVVAREDVPGEKTLVAYCVPAQGRSLGVHVLREWCARSLPGYMVPTGFVFLPALPTTTSGKVDRLALPAPEPDRDALETPFVEPSTPAERAVARIWAEALWVDDIGAHDDFFDLGGDSLIATRVALSLTTELGVPVTVQTLFAHPTVADLAAVLTAARRGPGSS